MLYGLSQSKIKLTKGQESFKTLYPGEKYLVKHEHRKCPIHKMLNERQDIDGKKVIRIENRTFGGVTLEGH